MIDLYPFGGYTVVVLGLGDIGISTARALQESNVTVWAWDENPDRRAAAESLEIKLVAPADINWQEPVTLVIEPDISHGTHDPHPLIAAAKAVNCEVISDVELLARVQNEAAYIGVTGHHGRDLAADVIGYVLEICGREMETTGLANKVPLELYPLGEDCAYVLDMPAGKLDTTVSVTFDVAAWLGFDADAIINGASEDEEVKAMSWIFHRQTAPKTAVVCIDDAVSKSVYEDLRKTNDQVVVGVSAKTAVTEGIGVRDDWLIDDREGSAIEVINLADTEYFGNPAHQLAAVVAYACGVSIGLAPHAVMACLNSYAPDEDV